MDTTRRTREGSTLGGKLHGRGKKTKPNGTLELGYFVEDHLHGEGCTRRTTDGGEQNGRFWKGALEGEGNDTRADGTVYEGTFARGVLHGMGKRLDPDGTVSGGTFRQGKLHGQVARV